MSISNPMYFKRNQENLYSPPPIPCTVHVPRPINSHIRDQKAGYSVWDQSYPERQKKKTVFFFYKGGGGGNVYLLAFWNTLARLCCRSQTTALDKSNWGSKILAAKLRAKQWKLYRPQVYFSFVEQQVILISTLVIPTVQSKCHHPWLKNPAHT